MVHSFVGSITRRIGFVRLYSRTLKWLLAINVVLGIAAIVLAFVADRQTIVDICTGGSTDSDVVRECGRTSTKVYRYSLLVMIVVQWIVQLCASLFLSLGSISLRTKLLIKVRSYRRMLHCVELCQPVARGEGGKVAVVLNEELYPSIWAGQYGRVCSARGTLPFCRPGSFAWIQ